MSADLVVVGKLLTWCFMPAGMLTLALLALLTRRFWLLPNARIAPCRWAAHGIRGLMIIGLVQAPLTAIPWLAQQIAAPLEAEARALASQAPGEGYAGILILGGTMRPAVPALGLDDELKEAIDRVVYGAALFHKGLAPMVVVSGGSVQGWAQASQPEAAGMRRLLLALGVPDAAILIEDQSTTTTENALLTLRMLQAQGLQGRLALVTSATHMPRAFAELRRVGLEVAAYPTDWQVDPGALPWWMAWLPSSEGWKLSQLAIKEWLGRLTLAIRA